MLPLRGVLTETAVLGVGLGGWLLSRRLGRRWTGAEIVILYLVGLLFELLTAHFWRYHHILLTLPTPIDDDISLSFALGWAGLVMAATAAAEGLWARWSLSAWWARHLALCLPWLVLGGAAEALFYMIGMIEYTVPEEWILIPGRLAPLPPTNFMVGYALLPPFVSWLMLRLESGLLEPASRAHR